MVVLVLMTVTSNNMGNSGGCDYHGGAVDGFCLVLRL